MADNIETSVEEVVHAPEPVVPSEQIIPPQGGTPTPGVQSVTQPLVVPLSEQLGRLTSRLSRPVTLDYGTEKIRLAPRGTTNDSLIRGLLGPLPGGVVFIPR